MATRMERKRVMFAAGKLAAKRRPSCAAGHIGPFRYDAAYTAWMADMAAEVGLPTMAVDYGQCGHCMSHVAIPAGARAA